MVRYVQAKSIDLNFSERIKNQNFKACVHSKFSRTINIVCSEQKTLYTIASNTLDSAPNEVIIDIRNFNEINAERGDNVCVDGDFLYIGGELRVNMQSSTKWKSKLPCYPDDKRKLVRNISSIQRHIANYGQSGGMKQNERTVNVVEKEYTRLLQKSSQQLLQALLLKETAEAIEYATDLIGLGPGLTPSGDDYLVGLFTILNLPNSPCYQYREITREIVRIASGLTNAISYAALQKSSVGEVRQSIVNFVQSILYSDEKNILQSLDDVLNIGSSSGTDIAIGLTDGLRLNLEQEEKDVY